MTPTPAASVETGPAILVVDDVEANRDALARRLRRRGYTVIEAAGGREALGLIATGTFDLVLLDVMMPDVNGLDVLRAVRKERSAVELPVIMATARAEGSDVVEALQLGANDYVTKPLDFPVVFARVQTQLDLRRAVRRALELEKRLARDLKAAARIQESLLPREFAPPPGWSVAWAFRPCDELAGDALNVCQLDGDHIAMYVLDVTGHGVAPALLAVTVTRVLSPAAGQESLLLQPGDGATHVVPPAAVADRLALQFPFDSHTELFFTLAYAVLDVPKKALRYVSAGHPPGVVVPADGSPPRFLPGTGLPVGLGTGYEEHTLPLATGDRVYWYSDGVPEASEKGGELFGNDRLLALLAAARGEPLAASVTRLETEVMAWCGATHPRDDVSILAVEVG